MEKESPLTQPGTTTYEVGGTTFIVRSSYNPNAKEGLVDKIVRMIENSSRCADTRTQR